MSNTEEVLVVGAGPVGLVAACQLARLGVHVRVIDPLPQRTTQSRAVGIQARSLEMLASLGVLPRLELRGRRMRALEVVDGRTGGTRALSTWKASRAGIPTCWMSPNPTPKRCWRNAQQNSAS